MSSTESKGRVLTRDTKCDRCGGGMRAGEPFWWSRKGGGYAFRSCGAAPERYNPAHAFNCLEAESLRADLVHHDGYAAGFVAGLPADIQEAATEVMAAKRAEIVSAIARAEGGLA